MDNDILPVESIRERDVDLILLEELSINITFSEWFINELDLPKLTSMNGAWRSISDFGLGETDILFSYNSNDNRIFVLIENKLDATFQDEQFERYTKRANKYIEENKCDNCYVILVAPKIYCENQSYFENYLTYETIVTRFNFLGSKRYLFKKNLLEVAINKLRRGYKPVNSIPVQKFWHSYWDYRKVHFPNLDMKKPDIVPHNSDWPMLYDLELPNIIFYHKMAQGNTDATFKGYSQEVEFKIREILPEWLTFVKHNKSFSLRMFSEKIDRTKDFNQQIDSIRKGLENLERIRKWLKSNYNSISKTSSKAT